MTISPVYVGRWNNRHQAIARAVLENAIEERDGRGCFYCGSELTRTIDHVTARACGGSDEFDNLVFACRVCNWMKLDHPGWLYALWSAVFGPSRIKPSARFLSRQQRDPRSDAIYADPFGVLPCMGAGGFEPPNPDSVGAGTAGRKQRPKGAS